MQIAKMHNIIPATDQSVCSGLALAKSRIFCHDLIIVATYVMSVATKINTITLSLKMTTGVSIS